MIWLAGDRAQVKNEHLPHQGWKGTVSRMEETWARVEFDNGKWAWIHQDDLTGASVARR